MTRMEELNLKCVQCMADAAKRFENINPVNCANFCPIGREIHQLEVESGSKWNEVNWTDSRMEDLYHH